MTGVGAGSASATLGRMEPAAPAPLTQRQSAVLGVIEHWHSSVGRPCPAPHVAEKLGITRQSVSEHLKRLHELGYLAGPGAPATPVRRPDRGAAPRGADVPSGEPRTVDMPPMSVRAEIRAATIDEDERTVELIFTTGADVERMDWWTGKRYIERLSLDPAHVRLERLNAGASLLDSHSAWSVSDVLGAVVPGTAQVSKKEGRVTVRFSRREQVEPVWQDVRDGIISSVSVGYRIHRFEEKTPSKTNALPIRTAVDWEPFEVSMVPIPADAGARVRSGEATDTNPCQIVPAGLTTRAQDPPADSGPPEESAMDEDRSETIVETDPLAQPAAPAAAAPAEPTERDEGARVERERCQGIMNACRAARLPQSVADKLIADKTPLLQAQSRIFEELAKRDPDVPRAGARQDVRVGEDPFVHVRAGIENALLHRVAPGYFKLEDIGKPYRGMSMLDVGRAFLHARGMRTTGLARMELAGVALGLSSRAGMHTTSDFALLLADVAGKTLRAAYEAAPQTFAPISRRVTLPDFKSVKRLQIGEAPALLEVDEHGEYTYGTIGEGREQFQLATYGRVFAITRKALVNDDVDAFSRVPTLFGRSARNLESDLVWAEITANGAMADGENLFSAAHSNWDNTGAAISVASIGAARASMRKQTGLDGATLLNIMAKFLVVPAALETLADQFVSQALLASSPGSVNPFAGRLQVIAEPRLDANSAQIWYVAASPDQIDMIEYAYLEGEEGPQVESRIGFDVDGLEVKCRLDFAAKVIEYRGLYRNAGVAPS